MRKPKNHKPNAADEPRPNKIQVSITGATLDQLDAFRAPDRLTRSHAAALLIERALQAQKAG